MSRFTYSAAHLVIERVSSEDIEVLRVRGDVDIYTGPLLERAIAESPSGQTVIVDFSACPYLDCAAIAVLIRARKKLGPELRLVVPADAQIRRIFSIVRLDSVLRIETSIEAIRCNGHLENIGQGNRDD